MIWIWILLLLIYQLSSWDAQPASWDLGGIHDVIVGAESHMHQVSYLLNWAHLLWDNDITIE